MTWVRLIATMNTWPYGSAARASDLSGQLSTRRRVHVGCPPAHRLEARRIVAVGRPGISRSLKQVLSFGCGLLRLRCSTCVVAPYLAWP
jgi:hypothetical protein